MSMMQPLCVARRFFLLKRCALWRFLIEYEQSMVAVRDNHGTVLDDDSARLAQRRGQI
jgi:hypothetical protein